MVQLSCESKGGISRICLLHKNHNSYVLFLKRVEKDHFQKCKQRTLAGGQCKIVTPIPTKPYFFPMPNEWIASYCPHKIETDRISPLFWYHYYYYYYFSVVIVDP